MNNRLATIVSILVVGIWAVSMIVDMIPQAKYEPPVAVYPALMLVLGGIFGVGLVKKDTNGGKE